MTELDLTEAGEMAATLYKGLTTYAFAGIPADDYDGAAAVLTANLVPIIERQVRDRIAAALVTMTIDSRCSQTFDACLRMVRGGAA